MKKLIIAIDGPAASGKSSTARRLAESLGYLYIDSGAMYRACALEASQLGISLVDHSSLREMIGAIDIDIRQSESGNRVIVNERDVTDLIREEKISRMASDISAIGFVRERMVELQRKIGENGGVVMDGRDIGTVVFPQADVKFFMIANVEERAKRRYQELIDKGCSADLEAVLADLNQRDENDTNRAIAPLKPAHDSILIDTTKLTLDEQVRILNQHIRQRSPLK